MSDLISGKEALIALANGELVQCKNKDLDNWCDISDDCPVSLLIKEKNRNGFWFEFRIKPKTILLNGIEVPAPFEPKEGELFWHISPEYVKGYGRTMYNDGNVDTWQQFGAYRTEEQIKQVVAALRSIFNAK